MSLQLPKCDFCKYLEEGDSYRCPAFPKGIPLKDIPYDKDIECANGIKFEVADGVKYSNAPFVPAPDSILAKMHRI